MPRDDAGAVVQLPQPVVSVADGARDEQARATGLVVGGRREVAELQPTVAHGGAGAAGDEPERAAAT